MEARTFTDRQSFVNEIQKTLNSIGRIKSTLNATNYKLPYGSPHDSFEDCTNRERIVCDGLLTDVACALCNIIGEHASISAYEINIEAHEINIEAHEINIEPLNK